MVCLWGAVDDEQSVCFLLSRCFLPSKDAKGVKGSDKDSPRRCPCLAATPCMLCYISACLEALHPSPGVAPVAGACVPVVADAVFWCLWAGLASPTDCPAGILLSSLYLSCWSFRPLSGLSHCTLDHGLALQHKHNI